MIASTSPFLASSIAYASELPVSLPDSADPTPCGNLAGSMLLRSITGTMPVYQSMAETRSTRFHLKSTLASRNPNRSTLELPTTTRRACSDTLPSASTLATSSGPMPVQSPSSKAMRGRVSFAAENAAFSIVCSIMLCSRSFPACESRRLLRRLEFHCTRNNGPCLTSNSSHPNHPRPKPRH